MNWLELTALDGTTTLVRLDQVDYISTGYELPGCAIHFLNGNARSVSEDIQTIKKAIQGLVEGNG